MFQKKKKTTKKKKESVQLLAIGKKIRKQKEKQVTFIKKNE